MLVTELKQGIREEGRWEWGEVRERREGVTGGGGGGVCEREP